MLASLKPANLDLTMSKALDPNYVYTPPVADATYNKNNAGNAVGTDQLISDSLPLFGSQSTYIQTVDTFIPPNFSSVDVIGSVGSPTNLNTGWILLGVILTAMVIFGGHK